MLDLKQEKLIALGAACRGPIQELLGRKIAPATACRWITKGILAGDGTRVSLRAVKIGRSYMTTASSIDEFFAALAQHTVGAAEVSEVADAEVEASLKAAGLKF